jgi:APA family basic amino acid/polyamine antiporter
VAEEIQYMTDHSSPSGAPGLRRGFGFWTGSFVVVASMVGAGILTNSGPILKMTGSYTALLLLWGVGGLFAMTGALTLAELGSAIPRAGGDYVFVREAFGKPCGFVYGWSMVLLGFSAPTALIAFTAASYLHPIWNAWSLHHGFHISEEWFITGLAAFLIVLFTTLHCLGQHTSARVQIATTSFNFLVLAGFATVGATMGDGHGANFLASRPFFQIPFPSLATGFVLVMYAYTGWNAAVYLAGEIRDPQRLIPKCLAAGCLAVALLYVAMNVTYGLGVSVADVAGMSDIDANRLGEVAITRLLGGRAGRWFSILVSVGIVASLSAYILTGPRIIFAMAEDKLFPPLGKKVSARTGTPVVATVLQSAAALGFLFSGTFDEIMTFTSYGLAVLGALVVMPIFVLRRRPASEYSPRYRVPLYPWTTILFLVVTAAVLIASARDTPGTALLSVASILAGFPLYFIFKHWLR